MNITYRQMQKEDIAKVTPLFIEYWNGTGDEWTPELVYSRVWQVLGSPDSYCMIAEDGENVIGFAMGRFETFYDLWLTILWRSLWRPNTKKAASVQR